MFSNLQSEVVFLGSANAKSIRDNIQYFIAFNIPYMALWDNDGEGQTYYEKAKKNLVNLSQENFIYYQMLMIKAKLEWKKCLKKVIWI